MEKEELIRAGMDPERADRCLERVDEWKESDPYRCWEELKGVLSPDTPKDALVRVFMEVFSQDDRFSDAPRAWEPSGSDRSESNINELCRLTGHNGLEELFEWSLTERGAFWKTMTETLGIPFRKEPDSIADFSKGVEAPEWFPGGRFNIADACFQADPSERAIVFKKENGSLQEWSYGELKGMSDRVANGLQALGFKKGDRAVIESPQATIGTDSSGTWGSEGKLFLGTQKGYPFF